MNLVGVYIAHRDARHHGDFTLQLFERSDLEANGWAKATPVHTINTRTIPKTANLKLLAAAWCRENGHTLKIDESSLAV